MSASKSPEEAENQVADFERSLDALEALVQKMESGGLSLEDSLDAYERGIALYRRCRAALDAAELRVKLLTDPLDESSAEDFRPDSP